MTTLITGAGLVGTAFGRRALKRGERLVFLDTQERDFFLRLRMGPEARYERVKADVRDRQGLVDILRLHAVDVVVHTAGLIGKSVGTSLGEAVQVNVVGSANVAEAVHRAAVRRLLLVSSFGVYRWRQKPTPPVTESFPRGDGSPYSNLTAAKEAVVEAYAQRHAFELVVVRPANVFGLGHFAGGSSGGKRIRDLLLAGLRGERLRIAPEQAGTDEYLYAEDLGLALDAAATAALPSPCFINLGMGCLTTFASLIDAASKVIPGLEVAIEPGASEPHRSAPLDISAAKRLLGWQPAHSIDAGLADYLGDLRALGPEHLERLQL